MREPPVGLVFPVNVPVSLVACGFLLLLLSRF
jgi:hypothetical protein